MTEDYMPDPRCPNCDEIIKEGSRKCPHCEHGLVYCERGGHLVIEDDYDSEVDMCDDCWAEVTKD